MHFTAFYIEHIVHSPSILAIDLRLFVTEISEMASIDFAQLLCWNCQLCFGLSLYLAENTIC